MVNIGGRLGTNSKDGKINCSYINLWVIFKQEFAYRICVGCYKGQSAMHEFKIYGYAVHERGNNSLSGPSCRTKSVAVA